MSLVTAGIAPHGFSIIPEIAGDELELFRETREGMKELGRRFARYNPDTIIIITPHGLRLKGFNSVYTCEYSRGILKGGGNKVSAEYHCDQELAFEILEDIEKAGIPVVGANYGALSGPASNIEMDWGTLIPLWFCAGNNKNKPEIVVITPTREVPLDNMVKMGKIIADVAEESSKRVALIASADQGHCHEQNGPYGYHKSAEIYDKKVVNIIKEDDLSKLLELDPGLIEEAKPDSLWQMLILYGALQVVPMSGKLISYQVPTYFGMLVASYER